MTTTDPAEFDTTRSWRNWLARHLSLQGAEKFEIYTSVAASATLRDATYWAEILFSAGIATLGLTLNSAAVIIGAMLISPLMGPIMSSGLALAAGDFILALRAFINIVLSSLTAILFSTLLVVLLPFREMTTEIASRTQPNTLDLVVALFSGAVAALAVSKSLRGVATSIPGVAIAVALMPPLCVTGYGLGLLLTIDRVQGMAVLRGGGLLFLTNLIAITFTSMIVFLLLHIDADAVRERIRDWRRTDPEAAKFQQAIDRVMPAEVERIGSLPARILLLVVMIAVVFMPLKRSFDALSAEIGQRQKQNRAHRAASEAWQRMFARSAEGVARSFIDSLEAVDGEGRLSLNVRAFISSSISPEEREAFAREVAGALGRDPSTVQVSIVEIPTSTYQLGQVKQDAAQTPVRENAGPILQRVSQQLLADVGATRMPPASQFIDAALTIGPSSPIVTINYLSAQPISDDARSLITADLRDRVGIPNLGVSFSQIPMQTPMQFNSVSLSEDSIEAVDALGLMLRSRATLRVIIVSSGNTEADERRAGTLRAALLARGIPPTRIERATSAEVPEGEIVLLVS